MKKLLIVTYGGGHFKLQLEVAKFYKKRGWKVTFLTTPNATILLKDNFEFEILTFKDLLTPSSKVLGEIYGDEIYGDEKIEKIENDAYAGVNVYDLIRIYGEKKGIKLFKQFGRRVFFPVLSLKEIFVKLNPDLISVSYSAARAERASIVAAHELGIKTMAIEDLLGTAGAFSIENQVFVADIEDKIQLINKGMTSEKIFVDENFKEKTFYVPAFQTSIGKSVGLRYKYYPDYIFCINEYVKKNLVKRGVPIEHIHVVGQPIFDKIVLLKKEKFNVIQQKKKVLITTQPLTSKKEFLEIIKESISVLSNKFEIEFVLRTHPSDTNELEKEIADNFENVNLSFCKDFYKDVQTADLLVTQTSTTAIESSILEVPTLSLLLKGDDFLDFGEAGICLSIKQPTSKEVVEVIINVLTNKFKYQKDGLEYCDGNSMKRIYEVTNI